MSWRRIPAGAASLSLAAGCWASAPEGMAGNPVIPGYFADPSIVSHDGEWFIYATIDPWGGDTLGLWRSRDFRHWTFSTPDWPTKAAATSPTSGKSKVWAPSVVKTSDGRFWMYVSIGNEIWVGTAAHPAGPWRDANGGKPLIPRDYRPGLHMIDAEAFIDDDGQAYLYWGSGLNWVNGHCFVVKLRPDMVTFDGVPRDVTPAHYFEAPFMLKRDGRYFLTYSWGNTTTDTYQVRYAVGDSPLGPFTEPMDVPILATDRARQVISPGHHAIFRDGGHDLILYHRQALPFVPGGPVRRQIAVDRLIVKGDRLVRVTPTRVGATIHGAAPRRDAARRVTMTASTAEPGHAAAGAGDDDYATGWRAPAGDTWLQADLGTATAATASLIRSATPATPLSFSVSTSSDGVRWRRVVPLSEMTGSPIKVPALGTARYVRLSFPQGADILDWTFPS
ncbi:family 43 glycosylhydrolase [Sphingomonas sp. RHCKR7]|uniref:family 43 glycosylhydrolase n=1 Tax=Sphingomonas folli TaxID=2862497 RepID=UPI001CA58293|nr:family 43 glycosylhydrolase [Sphingomonas folli]MBW6525243.1 family 43 glycosylhydrolase [Sphingomonas folli]